jgi:hypothetical protein
VLLHCFAGCTQDEVINALRRLNLWPTDDSARHIHTPLSIEYIYRDSKGRPLCSKIRFGPKKFGWEHQNSQGIAVLGRSGITPPLYNLPHLIKAIFNENAIVVTEGEKDADTLTSHGFIATTNPDGAGKWRDAYTESLTDGNIVICGDNDEPGQKHVQKVIQAIIGKVKQLRVIQLPLTLNNKSVKDVSDWFNAGGTAKEFQALIDSAKNIALDRFGSSDESKKKSTQVGVTSWPAIVPFSDDHGPEIPATLIPGIIGQYAEALARSTETPPALACLVALSCLSTAANKKFSVQISSDWHEPVNLYTVVALPPGSRKSPVFSRCRAPVEEWDRTQRAEKELAIRRQQAERITIEEDIKRRRSDALREKDIFKRNQLLEEVTSLSVALPEIEALPSSFTTDATPEVLATKVAEQDGRFAVLTDEGGIIEVMGGLYSDGKANIDIYLKGWDGGTVRVERRDRSTECNPYITMCLAIQPKVIADLGKRNALQGNGMMERILWCIPKSNLGERSNRAESIPSSLSDAYANKLFSILRLGVDDRKLYLSDEAQLEFLKFRDSIEEKMRPGQALREISGWASKLPGQVIRIAGLLHIARNEVGDTATIDKETLSRAISFGTLLQQHALNAFAAMGGNSRRTCALKVLEYLPRFPGGTFTKTQLREVVKNIRSLSGRNLGDALNELCDRGYIRSSVDRSSSGKPTTYFEVNPLVTTLRT